MASFRLRDAPKNVLDPQKLSGITLPFDSPTASGQIIVYDNTLGRFIYKVVDDLSAITTLTGQKQFSGSVTIGSTGTPINRWSTATINSGTVGANMSTITNYTGANDEDTLTATGSGAPPGSFPMVSVDDDATTTSVNYRVFNAGIVPALTSIFHMSMR